MADNISKGAVALRYLANLAQAERDSYIRRLADAVELNDHYHDLPLNDKYKHALINCMMAQNGEKSEKTAALLSGLKENYDIYFDKNKTKDSDADMEANIYGRKIGRENRGGSCDELVRQRYHP